MQSNIRGELTGSKPPYQQDFDLIDAVARSLHIQCHELEDLDSVLFPAMLCAAVEEGDINKLAELKGYVSTILLIYRIIQNLPINYKLITVYFSAA